MVLGFKQLRQFAIFACLAAPVQAATVFTSESRSEFGSTSSVYDLNSEGFDSVGLGTFGAMPGFRVTTSVGAAVVTDRYRASSGKQGLGSGGQNYFSATQSVTFTFTSPITAFAIDINTFAKETGAFRAILNTGGKVLSVFDAFAGLDKFGKPIATGQFIGFHSETAFSSFTIVSKSDRSYTLDTLYYGTRKPFPAAVPVPASLGLLMSGFTALAALGYRRRIRA